MSQPSPLAPRRYLRTGAEYRWTGPKLAQFLRALAATGSVTKAARAVGMSRQSACTLRARMFSDHGPEFGRLWDEALAMARSRKIAVKLARMSEAKLRKATRVRKMTIYPPPCL